MLTYTGDEAIQALIEEVRGHMSVLFKIGEAIAMLDMVGYFPRCLLYIHSLLIAISSRPLRTSLP